ncbi:truncated sodium/calcium exchanging protein [Methanothermobacter sp. CaT2]|nr:truncated sodium/calcium exchanging protein [Methanothermobacter sp. CaT2]
MLERVLILIVGLVASLILVIKSADLFVDNLVDLGSSLGYLRSYSVLLHLPSGHPSLNSVQPS